MAKAKKALRESGFNDFNTDNLASTLLDVNSHLLHSHKYIDGLLGCLRQNEISHVLNVMLKPNAERCYAAYDATTGKSILDDALYSLTFVSENSSRVVS